METWLYPISKNSGHWFTVGRKKTDDSGYESFAAFAATNGETPTPWLGRDNLRKARPGESVLIYTGDQNHGIIGFAEIRAVAPERRRITLQLNMERTSALLLDPVPAPIVRQCLRWPRTALRNFTGHLSTLEPYFPWSEEKARRDQFQLDPLNLRPLRTVFMDLPARQMAQTLSHDSRLLNVQLWLTERGFSNGTTWLNGIRPDLVAVRDRDVVVVEAKVIEAGRGRNEARAGVGQLLEYSWELGQLPEAKAFRFHKWLAFSGKADLRLAAFLHDHGVIVSWVRNGGLKFYREPHALVRR